MLVFDDADMTTALDMGVLRKYRNSGQVCVSPTRFYVQESIYQPFLKGFAERTAKVKVGNGLEADTKMGPLAHKRRVPAIAGFVEDAGARRVEADVLDNQVAAGHDQRSLVRDLRVLTCNYVTGTSVHAPGAKAHRRPVPSSIGSKTAV